MPPLPLPPQIDAFLRRPNPAVLASLRPDGSPHTVATWYLWDGERALLNMDESRLRLRFMRRDPRVALTALGEDEWYRHASLLGRVAELAEDRLASRMGGRERRTAATVSYTVARKPCCHVFPPPGRGG